MSSVLADHALEAHSTSDSGQFSVSATVSRVAVDALQCDYVVTGPLSELVISEAETAERTDGLWQTTCFELFMSPADSMSYSEWNFATSRRWAAYRFDSYREGMAPLLDCTVEIGTSRNDPKCLRLNANIRSPYIPSLGNASVGLSAILEHKGGAKSFWALTHPPGLPDFHHRTCFATTLAPPKTA